MRTKVYAIALSAVLIANPLAGFAQQIDLSDPEVKAVTTPASYEAMMKIAHTKILDNLRSNTARVDTMIAQIDGMQSKVEDDLFLRYAKGIQGSLVIFNALAMKAHLTTNSKSDRWAYITVASALVNVMIRHWNPMTHSFELEGNAGRVDAKAVAKIIDQSITDMSSQPYMPKEVQTALVSLQKMKSDVEQKQSKLAEMIEENSEFQDAAAGLSGLSLLLNMLSPKLGKISQKLLDVLKPVTKRTKQGGSVAALLADAPEVVGKVLGIGSDEAQSMLLKILLNLKDTKANFENEIRCQSLGPVTPEQRKNLGC